MALLYMFRATISPIIRMMLGTTNIKGEIWFLRVYHHISKAVYIKAIRTYIHFVLPVSLQPNAVHGLLILEVSRSHTTTQKSRWNSSGQVIGSSQRPLSDSTHDTHNRNSSMPPSGIRTHNFNRRAAADLRFIPRGQRDRPEIQLPI